MVLEKAACGQKAIGLALALAKRLGVYFKLIHYSTSTDVYLDFSRVVGYAAIGGYLKQNKNDENFFLDEKVQKEALKIVKNTLKSFLTRRTIPKIKVKSKSLFKKLGCFVTLKKTESFAGVLASFLQINPFGR